MSVAWKELTQKLNYDPNNFEKVPLLFSYKIWREMNQEVIDINCPLNKNMHKLRADFGSFKIQVPDDPPLFQFT